MFGTEFCKGWTKYTSTAMFETETESRNVTPETSAFVCFTNLVDKASGGFFVPRISTFPFVPETLIVHQDGEIFVQVEKKSMNFHTPTPTHFFFDNETISLGCEAGAPSVVSCQYFAFEQL